MPRTLGTTSPLHHLASSLLHLATPGRYEAGTTPPLLDACGGSFGVTPESGGNVVYHYHVQENAPFTFGCYGPARDSSTGKQRLVTLAECRALYSGSGSASKTYTTATGAVEYKQWCPW